VISALTEEFTTEAAGTFEALEVRKARMADIPDLLDLINGYAARGIMLPRTEFEMSEAIRDFSVARTAAGLVGCGALHFYSPAVAEIRSLAVCEQVKAKGVGRCLVETLVNEAEEFSLAAVFAFTYVPEFFGKLGFSEVERGMLPLKVWKDCVRCPKFQSCDEVSVMRVLRRGYQLENTPICGYRPHPDEVGELPVFPILRAR